MDVALAHYYLFLHFHLIYRLALAQQPPTNTLLWNYLPHKNKLSTGSGLQMEQTDFLTSKSIKHNLKLAPVSYLKLSFLLQADVSHT